MMGAAKPLALLAAAGLALIALAGCADSASPADAATKQFQKNQERWALPLDSYRLDYLPIGAATSTLMAKCMHAKGFASYPVMRANFDAPPPENQAPSGKLILTVASAEKWGYRTALSKQVNVGEWKQEMFIFWQSAGNGVDEANTECAQNTHEELDKLGNPNYLQPPSNGDEDPRANPRVTKAAATWRTCMHPHGLADLPDDPGAMKHQYAMAKTKDRGEPTLNADDVVYTEPVPARERQIAVWDATCRQSSGYSTALYDTLYQDELATYTEHQDELERLKTKITTYEDAMKKIARQAG